MHAECGAGTSSNNGEGQSGSTSCSGTSRMCLCLCTYSVDATCCMHFSLCTACAACVYQNIQPVFLEYMQRAVRARSPSQAVTVAQVRVCVCASSFVS